MAGKLTVLLAGASSVGVLPLVRGQAEHDSLVTALLDDASDSLGLLGLARDGEAEGLTSRGPTSLQDDTPTDV